MTVWISVLTRLAAAMLVLAVTACDSVEDRVRRHYDSGQALLEEGADEKAVLEFRNALKLDDSHAPSHFALGTVLERQGSLAPALARYQRTLALDPLHVDARVKIARFLLVRGEAGEADEMIAEVLRRAPDRPDALVIKASAALRLGDLTAAREALDMAAAFDPGNAELTIAEAAYLVQTGDGAAAMERLDRGLDAHGQNLALHLMKLRLLEQTGDTAGLGTHLAEMIALFPGRRELREARVRWAVGAGETAIARAELEALAEAAPDDEAAASALVRFVRGREGDAAARTALEALIARTGRPRGLRLLSIRLDLETGRGPEARTALEALMPEAEAAGDTAIANRARLLLARQEIGAGNIEAADVLIAAVRASDPGNIDAARLHIARLIDREEFDAAISDVRTALGSAPDDVALLLLAGRAHDLAGNLDLAGDRLARAVRADDYRPATVARYVRFLIRTGRLGAAETVLGEAIGRAPEAGELIALMASVRLRREDWAGADRAANQLEPLDPARARQIRAASLIGQDRAGEGAALLGDLPTDERRRVTAAAALVEAHIADGKPGAARAVIARLMAETPEDIGTLMLSGNLNLATGALDAAETAYRAVLAQDAAHGAAHAALVRVEERRGDLAAARARLEEGLAAAPGNLVLLTRRAQMHELSGEFDAAIALYDTLYRRLPDSLVIANNLASLLSDHHAAEPEAVERAYRIAGRLAGAQQPHFRDTYGWTRYLKGQHKIALPEITAAARALPNNPWVFYHLGMVQQALGNTDEARTAFTRALAQAQNYTFPPRESIEATLAALDAQ